MLVYKCMNCFLNHPSAFRFQAASLPDNSVLNADNMKSNWSPLGFQTCIIAGVLSTLEIEPVIYHIKTTIVDTITSLQEGNTLISEVHDTLTKIHDILDKVVSKWIGNAAYISAFVFVYFASRQCLEVWPLQWPLFCTLKNTFPPSKTCLYGWIS